MNDLIQRLRDTAQMRTQFPDWLLDEMEKAADALERLQADACVALVADIRVACGDNGKRMQPELVQFIRELAADAERYRWLRDPCSGAERHIYYSRGDYGKGLMSGSMLDEAIDQVRGKGDNDES